MLTRNQNIIMDDLKLSKISVDKITQYGLRPPELLRFINMLEKYYRWFVIIPGKVKVKEFKDYISTNLYRSCWIDCLQRFIQVKKRALPEIMLWCDKRQNETNIQNNVLIMIQLFKDINTIVQSNDGGRSVLQGQQRIGDFDEFSTHVWTQLIYDDDDEKDHLPIPVFSYIIPTMSTSFLLHIMLSMGKFETEIDLITHQDLRGSLKYCHLIGNNTDEESLLQYANDLTRKWIIEQVQYFPNSQRVIDFWIITAYQLFCDVIVKNELPITEMPPVLLSTLLSQQQADMIEHKRTIKLNLIDAAFNEIGEDGLERCMVPSKEDLIGATLSNNLNWDPVISFKKSVNQSEDSFMEQKLAIETCTNAIDNYRNVISQGTYTKNVGIRGIPGGGKTWCMMYISLYAISKGLVCITTAYQCKRALMLGGIHKHQLFMLDTNDFTPTLRRAELAICSLLKNPKKLDF